MSVEHVLRVAADGTPVADVVFTAASATAAPTRAERFLHVDHLGSPDVITGLDGAVLERRSYDPFGKRRSPNWASTGTAPGPVTTSAGFTGHEEDDELGLVYMKGRTYDPKLGRFLQTDPFVQAPAFSQSWNPYAYVLNNPLSFTDPSGYLSDANCAKKPAGTPGCSSTTDSPGPIFTPPVTEGGSEGSGGSGGVPTGGPVVEPPPGPPPEKDGSHHDWRDETWMWGRGGAAPEAGRERSEGVNAGGGAPHVERRPRRTVEGGGEHGSPGWPGSGSERLPSIKQSANMIVTAVSVVEGAGLVRNFVKGVVKGAVKSVAELVKKNACFVAGTGVWTPDGLVPIEQVREGQFVLSRDEATGELGWKRVVRTFVTPDQPTLALSLVDDERGEHEQVEATAEHPFWAEGRGWVGAGSLQAGERVRRADGRWLRVEGVEAKDGRRTVYNLEVENFHTYVVGELGTWVHNACDPKSVAQSVKKFVSPRTLRPTHLPDSKSKVEKLAKAIKKNGYKPDGPIQVVEADGSLYIRDGHHRTAAAIKARVPEVEVEVTQAGSLEEAKKLFREWADTLTDAGH